MKKIVFADAIAILTNFIGRSSKRECLEVAAQMANIKNDRIKQDRPSSRREHSCTTGRSSDAVELPVVGTVLDLEERDALEALAKGLQRCSIVCFRDCGNSCDHSCNHAAGGLV